MAYRDAAELESMGIKALTDALGETDAQAFLTQWRGIPGRDFTKWRKEHPPQNFEEMLADIAKARKEDGRVLQMMNSV